MVLWTLVQRKEQRCFKMWGILLVALGVILVVAGVAKWTKKRDMAIGVGAVLLIFGGLFMGGFSGISDLSVWDDVTDYDIGGDGILTGCDEQKTIESLTVVAKTEYSNSYVTASGDLKYFEVDVDPTDSNANPIDSSTFSSGTVSDTSKLVQTCTPYHIIYDGGGTYYSEDLGIVTFDINDLNSDTGQLTWPAITVATVGTITDVFDETNDDSTYLNGATDVDAAGAEISCTDSADATINYNETAGDGAWYLKVTIECTGANTECRDMVIDFDNWESGASPEGNEISSLTAQLESGTDLGIPADLTNYWSNRDQVSIGTMLGGQSALYKFSWTYTEANLDTNDDYMICFDDLGEYGGTDVGMDGGASGDCIDFDATA